MACCGGVQDLALDAVRCVAVPAVNGGQAEVDIKKYVKVEKIPGGSLDDCRVLAGVMFNKARALLFALGPVSTIEPGALSQSSGLGRSEAAGFPSPNQPVFPQIKAVFMLITDSGRPFEEWLDLSAGASIFCRE